MAPHRGQVKTFGKGFGVFLIILLLFLPMTAKENLTYLIDLNSIMMQAFSPFNHRQLKIAVLTSDAKLARSVIEEAEGRGLKVDHVASLSEIPLAVKAVIVKRSEYKELEHWTPVYADEFNSATAIVDRAVEIAYSKKEVKQAVVAVDPGKTVGAAFLADNILLRMESFTDYNQLTESIVDFFKNHPNSEHLILVGSGAAEYREKLVSTLLSKKPYINPEMVQNVPEKNTSKLAKGRDEVAAVLLARMKRYARKG